MAGRLDQEAVPRGVFRVQRMRHIPHGCEIPSRGSTTAHAVLHPLLRGCTGAGGRHVEATLSRVRGGDEGRRGRVVRKGVHVRLLQMFPLRDSPVAPQPLRQRSVDRLQPRTLNLDPTGGDGSIVMDQVCRTPQGDPCCVECEREHRIHVCIGCETAIPKGHPPSPVEADTRSWTLTKLHAGRGGSCSERPGPFLPCLRRQGPCPVPNQEAQLDSSLPLCSGAWPDLPWMR